MSRAAKQSKNQDRVEILDSRSFQDSIGQLTELEQARCYNKIARFAQTPFLPGLNYERLGKGSQNHCSIRVSREMRVILAVDPDEHLAPKVARLEHAGHHNPAYKWSAKRAYHTDRELRQEEVADQSVARPEGSLSEALARYGSIDDWQLFLHPEQENYAQMIFGREARIRGGAGTGKTVIALHRAVRLAGKCAKEGGKVLFTTFSRSLTEHLHKRYLGIPGANDEAIDFLNIDRVAWDLLPDPRFDREKVNAAFDAAYEEVVAGTDLSVYGPEYLRAEVADVIKGRDATKHQYLDTSGFERVGRQRKLRAAERELCWKLREAWDQRMEQEGVMDFPDMLIKARNAAWQRETPLYRSVIVDEAQDMTLVGMQLARALVAGSEENNVPKDGLLMLDDSAQRIYAGGYKVAWARLKMKDRSFPLGTNYRNVESIVEAAKAVRGEILPVREDEDDGSLDFGYERDGGTNPSLRLAPKDGELELVASEVRDLIEEGGQDPASIGVLALHNDTVHSVIEHLKSCRIPCSNLLDLRDGELGDGVRVGTFDRGKGLEFGTVLIPALGGSEFPLDAGERAQVRQSVDQSAGEPTAEELEVRQLNLDRLYVGMTRARDNLILIADEEPCEEIQRACDDGKIAADRVFIVPV